MLAQAPPRCGRLARSLKTVPHHHAVAHVWCTFLSSRYWSSASTESKAFMTSSMSRLMH